MNKVTIPVLIDWNSIKDYMAKNDVIQVIRCKDCYAWREGECNLEEHGWCECHKMLTHMNDFCAWAERKEE